MELIELRLCPLAEPAYWAAHHLEPPHELPGYHLWYWEAPGLGMPLPLVS